MRILFTVCFGLLLAGISTQASAQGFGYKPAKDDPHYKIGELSFQYPKRFKIGKLREQGEKTVFLSDQKYQDNYLFVSLPGSTAEVAQTMSALKESLAAALLTADGSQRKWKQSEKPYGSYGQHEMAVEKWQTLSGKNRLFIELHHLRVKNQDIVAGYAFVMKEASEKSALAAFNRGYDAGSGPAGEGCSVIIASITGDDDITIGMPPPPAAPPKTKN